MRKYRTFHPEFELSAKQLIDITGVSRRTARAWINGSQNIHPAFRHLINLELEGRIIPADAGVEVTANKKGIIIEAGQYVFSFNELKTLWLDLQINFDKGMRLRHYEEKIEQIKLLLENH